MAAGDFGVNFDSFLTSGIQRKDWYVFEVILNVIRENIDRGCRCKVTCNSVPSLDVEIHNMEDFENFIGAFDAYMGPYGCTFQIGLDGSVMYT